MRRIAIIPARGGSKRLPRKNILDIAGLPMLAYPVKAAIDSGLFDQVIVSTEDPEIAEIAQKSGAEIFDRSDDLAGDKAQVINVCHDVLQTLDEQGKRPDLFCCIYATAVFITAHDLVESEKLAMLENTKIVMGVSDYALHPYKAMHDDHGYLVPAFPDKITLQSQQYPSFWASNGTIYWGETNSFMDAPSFYPDELRGYEIPRSRAPDIDTEDDYKIVCAMASAILE